MADILRHAPPVLSCLDELQERFPGEELVVVEIGVYKGDLAFQLLAQFPSVSYHAVDPWKAWVEGDSFYGSRQGKNSPEQWERIHNEFETKLQTADGGSRWIHRCTSAEAVENFLDGSVHFAFIDADHSYRHVRRDIELWLPKIADGGILAGHDYGGKWRGVQRAVHNLIPVFEVHIRELVWVYRKQAGQQ